MLDVEQEASPEHWLVRVLEVLSMQEEMALPQGMAFEQIRRREVVCIALV